MRALISVLGIALLSSGCFKPDVKNGGFACDPTVTPSCPSGFYCVNQLCVDHPGVSTGTGGGGGSGDMSVAQDSPDLAMTPVSSNDLAMSQAPADMAKPVTPPDLYTPPPPPDLSPVNTCAHDLCTSGTKLKASCSACATAVCASDPYCCSTTWDSTCITDTDTACDPADQC